MQTALVAAVIFEALKLLLACASVLVSLELLQLLTQASLQPRDRRLGLFFLRSVPLLAAGLRYRFSVCCQTGNSTHVPFCSLERTAACKNAIPRQPSRMDGKSNIARSVSYCETASAKRP